MNESLKQGIIRTLRFVGTCWQPSNGPTSALRQALKDGVAWASFAGIAVSDADIETLVDAARV